MKHAEFEIGKRFVLNDRTYLCTDKGTRTVAAIRVDALTVRHVRWEKEDDAPKDDGSLHSLTGEQAAADGWFNGPPYAVEEYLFDEDDQEVCEPCQ